MKILPELAWIDSTGFFTMDLGLSRIEELLERLGRPQDFLKFIHVAGSNGKGSICAFTECALRRAGFKTGFYLSPHLIRLNERFLINGKAVSDGKLIAAAEQVRTEFEKMRDAGRSPTYFEITTAIAAVLFREEKTDFVLWETGLGGRLDATNVVRPEVSVIASISLEHTAILGNTLAQIAREKCGIFKQNTPVVSGPVPKEAEAVIVQTAREKNAPLTVVREIPENQGFCKGNDGFPHQTVCLNGEKYMLGLPGRFQRLNAAVSAEILKVLAAKYPFDVSTAMTGFAETNWPARFQYIPSANMILDGAHNPGAAIELAGALREAFPGETFHLLTGCFIDKNAKAVLQALAPVTADAVFTAFDGAGRGVRTPDELLNLFGKIAPQIPARAGEIFHELSELPAKDGKMTLLCGSLHLCGEVLEKLGVTVFS